PRLPRSTLFPYTTLFRSETYLWPFFGYSDRTAPASYHEIRYLWPLFVQGRGDHYINRWAPFYTHSVNHGYDKQWFLWPVLRRGQDRKSTRLNSSHDQISY